MSSTLLDFAKAATRSSLSLNALNQVEKIVRKTISTSEPAIDKVPVGSVQPALFAGQKKRSCDGLSYQLESDYSRGGSSTGACDGARRCVMVAFQTGAQTSLPVPGRNSKMPFAAKDCKEPANTCFASETQLFCYDGLQALMRRVH